MAKLIRNGIAGEFYFTDENGNKSELFYSATDYKHGFAIVHKTKDSHSQYRDLLGRLSDRPTSSGICFDNFCGDRVKLTNIPTAHFVDKKFCDGIKKQLIIKLKAQALHQYNLGHFIHKERYASFVNEQFAFIDSQHETAVSLQKQQEAEKEEQNKLSLVWAQKEVSQQQEKLQALNDTLKYLENV